VVIVHEGRAALSQEEHDESFFCSELIVRAFEVVGAPIVSKPAHLTGPGTFEHTAALVRLGDLA